MKGFPDLPPIWAFGVAMSSALIGRFLPILSFEVPKPLVLGLLGIGFALVLWSALFFWRKKTTIEPHHVPTALIVEGPYRLSRNPIYLGMFLAVIAVALWAGALSSLLVAALFPIIITTRFIKAEEAMLRGKFGNEAEAYLGSTGRWIAGI